MSRSFTTRPTVSRTRGRGVINQSTSTQDKTKPPVRQAPTQPQRQLGQPRARPTMEPATNEPPAPPEQDLQQRMSYQAGFTMISPNEKKRREISEQARREDEAYTRHKEQSKVKHVSYVGTAGGGQITEDVARKRQIQTQQGSKFNSIQKRQEYKDIQKQKENETIMKKREEQRKKSEMNKRMETNRQSQIAEDHRKKNEDFLKRLENQQKERGSTKSDSRDQSTQGASKGHSEEILTQRQEEDTGAYGGNPADMSETDKRVQALQAIYPEYDKEALKGILSQTNNSVDAAIALLSQFDD